MLPLVLLGSALIGWQGPANPPDDPRPAAQADANPDEAGALAEYNGLKGKVAETGAAHWKMAQWCEQKGLRPEAYYHYGRVIELEPRREAAWQKLGFKKHDGRWMTAAQVAAEDAQKKADKEWAAKFKKWHRSAHGGPRQAETLAELDAVVEPAAVPSIYREFCGGAPADQAIGIQLLGQVEGPVASKALAVMAVYGKTTGVRRHATEVLRGRPAGEFLDLLVSLMKDLFKYEVKPVGGPGSPGVLFVEGEQFNARRFYAPPPPPTYVPRPGDTITYDANGFPVVTRTTVVSPTITSTMGVPGSKTLATQTKAQDVETDTYSFANAYAEAQRATTTARAQLAADVARLDTINEGFRQFNDLVMAAAQAATGKTPGRTAKEWRDLLAKEREGRSSARPRRPTAKPTIDEIVPLYLPELSEAITRQIQTRFVTQVIVDS